MTNYNEIAAEGLNNSNLYVDTLSHLSNKQQIDSAYSGSNVGIAVLPQDATNTFDANFIAKDILDKTQNNYDTVIVVVDKAFDTFGVSGNNATEVLTALNVGNTGDSGEVLLGKATEIKTMIAQPVTTTAEDGGGFSMPIGVAGGLLGTLALGVAVVVIIARGVRSDERAITGHMRAQSISADKHKGFVVDYDPEKAYTAEELDEGFGRWLTYAEKVGATHRFTVINDIADDTRDIISHWGEVTGNESRYELPRIILEYLPNTLKIYYELPDDIKDRTYGGKSPETSVREQLVIIEQELSKSRDAVFEGRVRDLEASAVFLKQKYQGSSFDLG